MPIDPSPGHLKKRDVKPLKPFGATGVQFSGHKNPVTQSPETPLGITGVQFLVCKTWREAFPMALAWVALIEAVAAVACFFAFFVLCRFREQWDGRRRWSPCSPMSVGDVKHMIEVVVPDPGDRQHFFNQVALCLFFCSCLVLFFFLRPEASSKCATACSYVCVCVCVKACV